MTVNTTPSLTDLYPPLRPLAADWVKQLTTQQEVLQQLLAQHGSPVNIHSLEPFLENYQAYAKVLDAYGLSHLIFFARKANKCRAFAQTACRYGFGVDTASFRELEQCLELGCDPTKLVSTAAIKDEALLRLAIQRDVLLVVDNADELDKIQRIALSLDQQAQIGLRISGFHFQGQKLYSRFGFDIEEVFRFLQDRWRQPTAVSHLQYKGLHFHLDGYSPAQRGSALIDAIALAEQLQTLSLHTDFIDIGGGLLMNYLADKQQWQHFDRSLQAAVRGNRPPLTFNNNGLGYEMIDGQLQGRMKVYPYYNELAKEDFLRAILETQNEMGQTAAALLKAARIELRMEPGRSLLDQTGVTVARVAHRKIDARGDVLVGLEMNMTQMYSSSADFLLDPIYIPQRQAATKLPTAVYFTGAYCLERDVLLKRKIVLPQFPDIGDLVVFVNTAGYMMHFFESEAHLFALAENLIYRPGGDACLTTDHFVVDADKDSEIM